MDKFGVYASSTELGNMDSAQQTHQSQQILSQLTNSERQVPDNQRSPDCFGE